MRHLVSRTDERFEIERLTPEAHWGGRARVDAHGSTPPDLGDYRYSVRDASGALLHQSGFESPAADALPGATTVLSFRWPHAEGAFAITVEKRRARHHWRGLGEWTLDPATHGLTHASLPAPPSVEDLVVHGPPASKVDLVLLADGYTASEHAKFVAHRGRALEYLFSVEPFKARASDFNVRSVFMASAESGVTDPYRGVRLDTALNCTYGEGWTERTLSIGDVQALRDLAAHVPYDFTLVLANSRRYGGSAFLGGPAVVAIDSASAPYLVRHEFGHAFAGLAEEYYIPVAGGPAYGGNIEPWQPNVTLSADSGKWTGAHGAPPRPLSWNKDAYDRRFAAYVERYHALRSDDVDEGRIEALMAAEREGQRKLLAGRTRGVGLYEGAHGFSRGVFRSQPDCIMFSLAARRFCTACTSAIERMIDHHTG